MKVIKVFKAMAEKSKLAFWTLMAFAWQVRADMPTTDDFADGSDDKDGAEMLMWLMEKFVQVVIVGMTAWFAILIIKGAMKKYNDISDERGSWMDLAGHVVGGLALLTLGIILFNLADTWVE
mgnify:FL=1|jgi:hypothetical protein|nr:DUF2976 domain-containing protein [Alteromonas macleodii]